MQASTFALPKKLKTEIDSEDGWCEGCMKLLDRESDLEDDEQEEPQDSFHATDEPDDEDPDDGGEEESDDKPTSFSERV